MALQRILYSIVVLLCLSSLIATSPAFHLTRSLEWNPYTRSNKDLCADSTDNVCSDDCKQVLLCPANIPVVFCDGETPYCHKPIMREAKCSVSSRCHGAPLRCVEEGVFPDPYFCSIYHTCSEVVGRYSEAHHCPEDSAYNIVTDQCDLPLDDVACIEGRVPECLSFVQYGALAANEEYYYRCRRENSNNLLYPDMHKCPHGEYFDATLPGLGACTVSTTSPPTETSIPTETTTNSPTQTTGDTTQTDDTTPTETDTTPTETDTTPTDTDTTPTETATTPTETDTTPTDTDTTPTDTDTTPTDTDTTPTDTDTTPTDTDTTPTDTDITPTETDTTPTDTDTTPTETDTTPTVTQTTATTTETTTTTTTVSQTPTTTETTTTGSQTTTTVTQTTPTVSQTTPTVTQTTPTVSQTTPTVTQTTPTIPETTPTETPYPTEQPPKDYTVTIIVSCVVTAVLIVALSVAGFCYLKKGKMKEPESRKLF